MTKFIFKSNASDLQKISQSIETLQKNTLYITYRVDALLKKINQIVVDKGLQKQVDQYFDDGAESYPGLDDSRSENHDEDKADLD